MKAFFDSILSIATGDLSEKLLFWLPIAVLSLLVILWLIMLIRHRKAGKERADD